MTEQEFKNKVAELAGRYEITINDEKGVLSYLYNSIPCYSKMRDEEIKLAKELFNILASYVEGYGLYAGKYKLQCTDKYIPYIVCNLIEELDKYKNAGYKNDEDISCLLHFPSLSELFDVSCALCPLKGKYLSKGIWPFRGKCPYPYMQIEEAPITEEERKALKKELKDIVDNIGKSIEETEKEKYINPKVKHLWANAIQNSIASYPSKQNIGAFVYDVFVLIGIHYDTQQYGTARSKYHCMKGFLAPLELKTKPLDLEALWEGEDDVK